MKVISHKINNWLASSNEQKNKKINEKHLKRALKELLDKLGFQTLALKPAEYYEFLGRLTLEEFYQKIKTYLASSNNSALSPLSEKETTFWVSQICKIHADAVAHKNPETTKNPIAVFRRFIKFLIEEPEWQQFQPTGVPEIRPRSHGKSLSKVYIERKYELYGFPIKEWSVELKQELQELKDFWMSGGESYWEELQEERLAAEEPLGVQPKVESISSDSFCRKHQILSLYFGFLVSFEQISKNQLTLNLTTNVSLIRKFARWQCKRKRSHAQSIHLAQIGIAVAKKKNFNKTRRRNWEDIEEVLNLRDLNASFNEKYQKENKESKRRKLPYRKLNYSELEQCSNYLLKRCAAHNAYFDPNTKRRYKQERSQSAICWDWQIYTIVSVFTYAPLRQQQVRKAVEGETLLCRLDQKQQLRYVVYSPEHKLKKHTGEAHTCMLPRKLTPILDNWVKIYRPKIVEAVQSIENWLRFWGYDFDELQNLQIRLKTIQQDQESQKLAQNLTRRIQRLERRIAAFPIAKANLENNNCLFFSFGGHHPETFGKPFSTTSLARLVNRAIAEAARALFDKEVLISPHVFRYIASLHVKQNNGDIEKLKHAQNHSSEMLEEYARVTLDTVDYAVDIDDWWLPS
jgi:polyhydroxyalkanoate synthesis regulator phasin